ncbi:MAG TPA: BREX-1 system adenine-specific DNA-methyltransferase PglX [Fimbriiglobus sp.]|nr:BREX-1 system adenine-specific DNA-methyltransferase PglX [Fimbriiglobus sp.]
MDQATRNKLRSVVTQCRRLLEEAVAQVLQGQFGVYAVAKSDDVQVEPASKMTHLSAEDQDYRKDILDHFEHVKALGYKPTDSLAQLVREVAFTHLNRLCAYKMMEARGLIRESVSKGLKSQGFLFYLADYDEDQKRHAAGQQDVTYRHFLNWLGGTLSDEIGVLFSPTDPSNRLYPPQRVLDEVLGLLNSEELAGIWTQDEAIGWVYQYFTPKELRDQARKESQAPRNSYELAFRNQFFTPRYVVEFLTDNTLGRIWHEMRQGKTRLAEQCRYLVRRPTEVFLKDGEQPPKDTSEVKDDLPQEELLKQPVFIPFRAKKDPRELKILDPACGSGHFLLYCFDLLLVIYEEAYADPELGPDLQRDYPTLEDLRKAVPALILKHNLHGIDIDLRATQIAALALWLRCQRAYQDMGRKKDRPKITKSNIVCAEQMPGEQQMLKEFIGQLEPKLLGQLVEVVFEKMKLAGEAGSLLKIEEEVREAVAEAKKQWVRETTQATDRKGRQLLFTEAVMDRLSGKPEQPALFDLSDITDDQFFEQAEAKVVETLREYAERAGNGQLLQRKLFTEDAVRGFAFVEMSHKRFDVTLMNPPFGISSKPAKSLIEKQYPRTKNDLYAAFIERGLSRLHRSGYLGAITSRSGFFLTTFEKWREEILLDGAYPTVVADLGQGVLDTAMVETAAYCVEAQDSEDSTSFFRLLQSDNKETALRAAVGSVKEGRRSAELFQVRSALFGQVPGSPFAYWEADEVLALFSKLPRLEAEGRKAQKGAYTNNDFRFLRLWWEIPADLTARTREETTSGKRWVMHAKGGAYSPFYSDWELVIDWENDGAALKKFLSDYRGSRGWGYQWSAALNGYSHYFRPGLTWARRTQKGFNVRVLPAGCIIGDKGPSLFLPDNSEQSLLYYSGVMNSALFRKLLSLQTAFGSYEVGVLEQTPIPTSVNDNVRTEIQRLSADYVAEKQNRLAWDETSHLFVTPAALSQSRPSTLKEGATQIAREREATQARLSEIQAHIDKHVEQVYGVQDVTCDVTDGVTEAINDSSPGDDVEDTDNEEQERFEIGSPVRGLVSYCCGVVVGRWDVRYVTNERDTPPLPTPFAALPRCSPGMLGQCGCLPDPTTIAGYPLVIDWDGILVDDADHSDDLVRRVRGVLEVIWKGRAEAIEAEACEILGVKELRDYFRKPGKGGFWDDHISRYSKSRRKAPIYWLLQSSKKNYALWLYYHRLDKEILFRALQQYVEPKIRLEDSRLDALRTQKAAAGDSGKAAKKLGKDMERQEDLLSELRDFEDKLRRVADLYLEPDLNDGVVLNIAPFHELVPWKEAKAYWQDLLKGEYEWSSIGKQLREKGHVK